MPKNASICQTTGWVFVIPAGLPPFRALYSERSVQWWRVLWYHLSEGRSVLNLGWYPHWPPQPVGSSSNQGVLLVISVCVLHLSTPTFSLDSSFGRRFKVQSPLPANVLTRVARSCRLLIQFVLWAPFQFSILFYRQTNGKGIFESFCSQRNGMKIENDTTN